MRLVVYYKNKSSVQINSLDRIKLREGKDTYHTFTNVDTLLSYMNTNRTVRVEIGNMRHRISSFKSIAFIDVFYEG